MVALARRAYARVAGDFFNNCAVGGLPTPAGADAPDDLAPGRGLAVATLLSLPLWALAVSLAVLVRAA